MTMIVSKEGTYMSEKTWNIYIYNLTTTIINNAPKKNPPASANLA